MQTHNFNPGPAILPPVVLRQVQSELLNFNNTGMSIIELSHRSPEFEKVIQDCEEDCRLLLGIPQNYKVLFVQGGASTQFSAVCYNLISDLTEPVDYICTGQWSKKAFVEAKRLGFNAQSVHNYQIDGCDFTKIRFSEKPTYIYYCDNETVDGIEMPIDFIDQCPPNVTVVCDMSSNFASRKVDISKYGVIFAGAQKNVGPSGLTIVIVRDDLLGNFSTCPMKGPLMLDYELMAKNNSLYNTPPCFSIYVTGLVFKYLKDIGIETIEKMNLAKAQLLYDFIDSNPNFCVSLVDKKYRSRMNVVFRLVTDGIPDVEIEKQFLMKAEKSKLIGLAGHRSVGGLRASIYNSLPIESVQHLIKFLSDSQP